MKLFLLGSAKGAAMVPCVAQRCSLVKSFDDEGTADYEKVN
jgi:hypothetical protein